MEPVILDGYLKKKNQTASVLMRSWNKRWFVLTASTLTYGTNPKDCSSNPSGVLKIKDIRRLRKRNDTEFELIFPDRVLLLKAEDSVCLRSWFEVLEKAHSSYGTTPGNRSRRSSHSTAGSQHTSWDEKSEGDISEKLNQSPEQPQWQTERSALSSMEIPEDARDVHRLYSAPSEHSGDLVTDERAEQKPRRKSEMRSDMRHAFSTGGIDLTSTAYDESTEVLEFDPRDALSPRPTHHSPLTGSCSLNAVDQLEPKSETRNTQSTNEYLTVHEASADSLTIRASGTKVGRKHHDQEDHGEVAEGWSLEVEPKVNSYGNYKIEDEVRPLTPFNEQLTPKTPSVEMEILADNPPLDNVGLVTCDDNLVEEDFYSD